MAKYNFLGQRLKELTACIRSFAKPQNPALEDRPKVIRLESLEPRVMYDASPFAALLDGMTTDEIDLVDPDLIQELEDLSFSSSHESLLVNAIDQFHQNDGNSEFLIPNPVTEIVFIDDRIDDYDRLVDNLIGTTVEGVPIEYELILLDSDRDGLQQISEHLDGMYRYDAVHVVSHGSAGVLQLGSTEISSENLSDYRQQLLGWRAGLSDSADILLYGCDLAGSDDGQWLVEQVSTLTGADIAASDDLTGHALLGGDWDLEFETGEIESAIAFSEIIQSNWEFVLATPSDIIIVGSDEAGLELNSDGGNDAYLLAEDSSFFDGHRELTLEFRFSGLQNTGVSNALFSNVTGGGTGDLFIHADGTLQLFGAASSIGSMDVFDGDEHTVTAAWNGFTGEIRYFVDGALLESVAGPSGITSGGDFILGQDQDLLGGTYDSTETFSGTFIDVRLFDTVRTDAQILANFDVDVLHDESNLLVNWQFDDLAPSGVILDTVNGNNLSIQHVSQAGFSSSTAELSFLVTENATNGSFVGRVLGVDADREAHIAAIEASSSDLIYSAATGKFYKLVGGDSGDYESWAGAQVAAQNTTLQLVVGELITIESATENEIAAAFAASIGRDIYINASDATQEGNWYWLDAGVDNDLFWVGDDSGGSVNGAYTNWLSGALNGTPNQDFGVVTSSGKWDDTNGNVATGYIVEFDGDEVADLIQALTYSIQSQTVPGAFAIDADSGEIVVADGSLLDFESASSHTVTVRVTDVDGNFYDENFDIDLGDVVEFPDAPSLSVPVDQTVSEDAPLLFNAANGNLISISDNTGLPLTVNIEVNAGTLQLSQVTGLVFSDGANGQSSLVVTGSLTDINAALDGLRYDPQTDFNGAVSLTITSGQDEIYALEFDSDLQRHYAFSSSDPTSNSGVELTATANLNGDAVVASDPQRGDVLSLDGAGDYVRISGQGSLPASTTVAAWVSGDAGDTDVISVGDALLVTFDSSSGGVSASYFDGVTTQDVTSGQFLAGTGWHHIAVTFDDVTKTMVLYIDGAIAGQNTFTNPISYGIGDTLVGTNATQSAFFTGQIDDVRITDRVLSISEIATIVAAPSNPITNETIGITVEAVNDAPEIIGLHGGNVLVPNDGTPVGLDPDSPAMIEDPDGSLDFSGGTLTVSGSSFEVGDRIRIDTTGTIALSLGYTNGSVVSVGGVAIGTLSGMSDTNATVDFNTNATDSRVETLIQSFTFDSTSNIFCQRSIDFDLIDGDGTANGGVDSHQATVYAMVSSAHNGLVSTTEDTPRTLSANDFDFTGVPDADFQSVTITSLPTVGSLTVNGGAVSVGDTISRAQIDSGHLEFTPDSDEHGSLYASFGFYVNEGKTSVTLLSGETSSYTFDGASFTGPTALITDTDNFGVHGTVGASIVIEGGTTTIDATYLSQGSILFNGFVGDGHVDASELFSIDSWVQEGGILISTSDSSAHDDINSYFGLTTLPSGSSTWQVAAPTSPIIDGPFGSVGGLGDPFTAAGTIGYFDRASLQPGDQIIATDSVSGEPTMVLRAHGSGHILFTSDEGIFRSLDADPTTVDSPNEILVGNIFAWATNELPATNFFAIDISVGAVNDAPVLDTSSSPELASVAEDAVNPTGEVLTDVLSGTSLFSDVDSGALAGVAVIGIDDSHGSWDYSTDDGSSWISFSAAGVSTSGVDDSSAVLLDLDARLRFVPVAEFNGVPGDLTFLAWDQSDGLVSGTQGADASVQGGASAFSLEAETISTIVTAVNDAPVLDNSGATTMTSITEDDFSNSGDQNSAILSTGAGGDPISDTDAGAVEGIAIHDIGVSNLGHWEYSTDGGSTWTDVGVVSDSSALLLTSNDYLRYVPDGDNGETAELTWKAWDQTVGATGTKVDASVTGGATAFSVADETTTVVVGAVNDAPVLDTSSSPELASVAEDAVNPTGEVLTDVLSGTSLFSDVDSGALAGVAVIGIDDSHGSWDYSTDDGSSWISFSAAGVSTSGVDDSSAVLLDLDARLRFVPVAEFNGVPGDLTFLAWDQSDGLVSGTQGADASVQGGASAFSLEAETISTIVTAVNDAPVLDNSGATTMTSITEDDFSNSGDQNSAILSTGAGGDPISDTDAGAVEGIAIHDIGVSNLGHWEYSTDGGSTWTDVGVVSDSSALLLTSNDYLRYVPNGEGGETASLNWKAWDQTSGTAGAKFDASTAGGSSSFSLATETITISVVDVNDAPSLDNATTPELSAIVEDATNPNGENLSVILAGDSLFTDVDAASTTGIAVIGVDNTNGVWEYSLDDGISWVSFTAAGVSSVTPNDSSALLLDLTASVRFVPAADFNGTPGDLIFRGWDQSDGNPSGSVGIDVSLNGGASAFSTEMETISTLVTAINDSSVITTNLGSSVLEGGSVAIDALRLLTSDIDDTSSDIIYAVVAAPVHGRLELTTQPGVRATTFTQDDIDNGRLVYFHGGGELSTDGFDFQVSDGLEDGAFAASGRFDLTIVAVNDTPDLMKNDLSVVEGGASLVSLNDLSAADVDNLDSSLTLVVQNLIGGRFERSGSPGVAITAFTIEQVQNGEIQFVDDGDETAPSYDVFVSDGVSRSNNSTATISFSHVNDEETIVVNERLQLNEGSVRVLDSAHIQSQDPDNTAVELVYSVTRQPEFGHVAFASDSSIAITTFTQDDIDNNRVVVVHVGAEERFDSFDFLLDDGQGSSSGGTVSLHIDPVNDAPAVVSVIDGTVEEGGETTLDQDLIQIFDPDDNDSDISIVVMEGPQHGHLAMANDPLQSITSFTKLQLERGEVIYVHDGGESSQDDFEFELRDLAGATSGRNTLRLNVTPVNDRPEGFDDTVQVDEDQRLNASSVLSNDQDVDGDSLGASLRTMPQHATEFVLNLDGTFTYQSTPDFFGTDTFTYNIDDGNGGTAIARVTIQVNPVNDAPVAVEDYFDVAQGQILEESTGVLFNDFDVENDALTAILIDGPSHGVVAFSSDGTFQFIPFTNFVGVDSFTYVANDGSRLSEPITVNIMVNASFERAPGEPDGGNDSQGRGIDSDILEDNANDKDESDFAKGLAASLIKNSRAETTFEVEQKFTEIDFDLEKSNRQFLEIVNDREKVESVLQFVVRDGRRTPGLNDLLQSTLGYSAYFDVQRLQDLDVVGQEKPLSELFGMDISIGAVSVAGTAGFILWSLRGGVLLATAISNVPTWKMIDPLPILDSYATDDVDEKEFDGIFN